MDENVSSKWFFSKKELWGRGTWINSNLPWKRIYATSFWHTTHVHLMLSRTYFPPATKTRPSLDAAKHLNVGFSPIGVFSWYKHFMVSQFHTNTLSSLKQLTILLLFGRKNTFAYRKQITEKQITTKQKKEFNLDEH